MKLGRFQTHWRITGVLAVTALVSAVLGFVVIRNQSQGSGCDRYPTTDSEQVRAAVQRLRFTPEKVSPVLQRAFDGSIDAADVDTELIWAVAGAGGVRDACELLKERENAMEDGEVRSFYRVVREQLRDL